MLATFAFSRRLIESSYPKYKPGSVGAIRKTLAVNFSGLGIRKEDLPLLFISTQKLVQCDFKHTAFADRSSTKQIIKWLRYRSEGPYFRTPQNRSYSGLIR